VAGVQDATVLTPIPVAIFFAMMERRIVSGLAAGAAKG
jgi:ABC-type maltose transport system permease subunit